jgi:hypothetical protein
MVVYSPAKRSSDAWMVALLAVPAMAAYCAPRSQSWSELKVVRGGETSTGTSAIWVEKPRRADGASLKRAADLRVQRIPLILHYIFVIRFGVKQIRQQDSAACARLRDRRTSPDEPRHKGLNANFPSIRLHAAAEHTAWIYLA